MELRHLKYFLVLAEELSFVKAADKLFISQPPLSRQIKELEDEIGVRLFNRNSKRVELTEAGKFYLKEVQQLMETLTVANVQAKKIGDHLSGEFRIGYISSTFSGHITALIKFLSEEYPYMNFRLYEVPTAKQIAAIEKGKLDLGIIRGPIVSPNLKVDLWFKDSYSLVYSADLMNLKSEKEIATLAKERFVFYNKTYAPHYYEALLQICAKFGFVPQVHHQSNNIASILQMVKEGLGISILPTKSIKNNIHQELCFLELKSVNLFSEVLLATPKKNLSPIAVIAKDFLLQFK